MYMIIYLLIGSNAIYKINEKWHQHSFKDIILSNLYLVKWSCLQIEPVQFFQWITLYISEQYTHELNSGLNLDIYYKEFVYCSISYMFLKWRCNCFGPSSVLTKNLNKTAFEPCNFWSQRKNRLHVCVRHAFESIFNEKNTVRNLKIGNEQNSSYLNNNKRCVQIQSLDNLQRERVLCTYYVFD